MELLENKVRVSNISQLVDDEMIKTLFTFIGPVSHVLLATAMYRSLCCEL